MLTGTLFYNTIFSHYTCCNVHLCSSNPLILHTLIFSLHTVFSNVRCTDIILTNIYIGPTVFLFYPMIAKESKLLLSLNCHQKIFIICLFYYCKLKVITTVFCIEINVDFITLNHPLNIKSMNKISTIGATSICNMCEKTV